MDKPTLNDFGLENVDCDRLVREAKIYRNDLIKSYDEYAKNIITCQEQRLTKILRKLLLWGIIVAFMGWLMSSISKLEEFATLFMWLGGISFACGIALAVIDVCFINPMEELADTIKSYYDIDLVGFSRLAEYQKYKKYREALEKYLYYQGGVIDSLNVSYRVGRIKATKSNGHGIFTYYHGAKATYEGEFKDKMRSGIGILTFPNGDKYEGEFKYGGPNGQGTYTFLNGDKYVGEFENYKMHGQGSLTYANGDKYVGEFKYDKMSGQDTFTCANRATYEPEFKDGRYIY